MIADVYRSQVELLLRILPYVAKEKVFALKGGTAINLFVRELPRLSVDIDLTYLPFEGRATALKGISDADYDRVECDMEMTGIYSPLKRDIRKSTYSGRIKEISAPLKNTHAPSVGNTFSALSKVRKNRASAKPCRKRMIKVYIYLNFLIPVV